MKLSTPQVRDSQQHEVFENFWILKQRKHLELMERKPLSEESWAINCFKIT